MYLDLNISFIGSLADSNSLDGESGFEEAEVSEVASGVTKVITRFIEKVGKFMKTQY